VATLPGTRCPERSIPWCRPCWCFDPVVGVGDLNRAGVRERGIAVAGLPAFVSEAHVSAGDLECSALLDLLREHLSPVNISVTRVDLRRHLEDVGTYITQYHQVESG